jgi:hypothetical protein
VRNFVRTRKQHQSHVTEQAFATAQAHLLHGSLDSLASTERFYFFCLFHAPLSIEDCFVQLVRTKFITAVFHLAATELLPG